MRKPPDAPCTPRFRSSPRTDFPPIRRRRLETLQVNLGYVCNQTCLHCHVNAGPTRTESMSRETVDQVLAYLEASGATTLDLTGGAPELNPHFRHLVRGARALGARVIDRCNLTILFEPGHEDLAEFLAAQRVEIVASLPCYTEELVDRQRGKGVYETQRRRAIRRLNALGYGARGLAASRSTSSTTRRARRCRRRRQALEADYKRILGEQFGIVFNRLFTHRQHADPALRLDAGVQGPVQRLHGAAARRAPRREPRRGDVPLDRLDRLAGLPLRLRLQPDARPAAGGGRARRARTCPTCSTRDLEGNPIVVRDHCYGCTAGQGSSCGGALA